MEHVNDPVILAASLASFARPAAPVGKAFERAVARRVRNWMETNNHPAVQSVWFADGPPAWPAATNGLWKVSQRDGDSLAAAWINTAPVLIVG